MIGLWFGVGIRGQRQDRLTNGVIVACIILTIDGSIAVIIDAIAADFAGDNHVAARIINRAVFVA